MPQGALFYFGEQSGAVMRGQEGRHVAWTLRSASGFRSLSRWGAAWPCHRVAVATRRVGVNKAGGCRSARACASGGPRGGVGGAALSVSGSGGRLACRRRLRGRCRCGRPCRTTPSSRPSAAGSWDRASDSNRARLFGRRAGGRVSALLDDSVSGAGSLDQEVRRGWTGQPLTCECLIEKLAACAEAPCR